MTLAAEHELSLLVKEENDLANRWESALRPLDKISLEQWASAFKVVDPETYDNLGDDAESEAVREFQEAAAHFAVGALSLDFPNSTHGDGSVVTVYLLPRGTSVLVRYATYEFEGHPGTVYSGTDCDQVIALTKKLLFTNIECGTIQNLDNDEEIDPDADAIYEGESALRKNWTQAVLKCSI